MRLWDTGGSRPSGAPRNIQGEGMRDGVGRREERRAGQGSPPCFPGSNKFLKFKNCSVRGFSIEAREVPDSCVDRQA